MATAGHTRGPGPERAFAPELPASGEVTLDGEESAHLVRSRRVRAGEAVVLFDGAGTTVIGRLVDDDPRSARVLVERAHPSRRPARTVRMAVALPEPARADAMVAALAELGVAELAALTSRRADPARLALAVRRRKRWSRAAREALKVNGCDRALAFGGPLSLEEALGEGAVVLDPDPAAGPLGPALGTAEPTPWILVGPEGGFTDEEMEAAREAGAPVAQIGGLALRTGTAAVAAAVVALT